MTGDMLPKGRLWDFIEKIAQSRREGKNRRDGATVSTRVLRHVETIGLGLFSAGEGADMTEEDRVELKRKMKRRAAVQGRAHL